MEKNLLLFYSIQHPQYKDKVFFLCPYCNQPTAFSTKEEIWNIGERIKLGPHYSNGRDGTRGCKYELGNGIYMGRIGKRPELRGSSTQIPY